MCVIRSICENWVDLKITNSTHQFNTGFYMFWYGLKIFPVSHVWSILKVSLGYRAPALLDELPEGLLAAYSSVGPATPLPWSWREPTALQNARWMRLPAHFGVPLSTDSGGKLQRVVSWEKDLLAGSIGSVLTKSLVAVSMSGVRRWVASSTGKGISITVVMGLLERVPPALCKRLTLCARNSPN